MTTQPHGNNRPVAFTGKPTRAQFQRHLSANPLTDHSAYAEYCELRRIAKASADNWGEWLAKNYRGTFVVLYSRCLNDPSTWEAVWAA